jgi:hypothetical protein
MWNSGSDIASELKARIPDSLTRFLKLAGHDYPKVVEHNPNFFYYFEKLFSPADLLAGLSGKYGGEVCPYWAIHDRYLPLYSSEMSLGFAVYV